MTSAKRRRLAIALRSFARAEQERVRVQAELLEAVIAS